MRNLGITAALLAVRAMNAIPASAQTNIESMKSQLEGTPTKMKEWVDPVINILLMIMFFSVAISLVIAYVNRRKENNTNSNDKLIEILWQALIVVVGIIGAKFIFW